MNDKQPTQTKFDDVFIFILLLSSLLLLVETHWAVWNWDESFRHDGFIKIEPDHRLILNAWYAVEQRFDKLISNKLLIWIYFAWNQRPSLPPTHWKCQEIGDKKHNNYH